MSDNAKKYNYCLDFIKGIACILVVFMHCEFPGILGTAVQAVSRFCVPLFFMVSGYFCYFMSEQPAEISSKMIKKIKHVSKITFYACIAYVLFDIVQYTVFDYSVFSFDKKSLLYLILFNKPFIVAGQDWFLFALLYDYILFALVLELKIVKQVHFVAACMIAVYIALAQGAHLFGIYIPNCFYRNFLIEGLCFFGMGNWIRQNQGNLDFNSSWLLAFAAICTAMCPVERFALGRDFGVNILTFPQVFCLFLYAVNNPEKHAGFVQIIGKRYSMFVYIIHPIVWHSMEHFYNNQHLTQNRAALYLMPLIVVTLTLSVSHLIYYAKNSPYLSLHR